MDVFSLFESPAAASANVVPRREMRVLLSTMMGLEAAVEEDDEDEEPPPFCCSFARLIRGPVVITKVMNTTSRMLI